MNLLEPILKKAAIISQKINDDVAFSVGGIGGGVISYWNNIKIIELMDFTVHAVLGGVISYGIKHCFEFIFKSRNKNGKVS
jgi:hypothetical protein